MIKSLLFFIALGANMAVATGAERRETVPARFLGEWNSKLQQCGTDRNDSRLRLDADRIRFHESGGPIRAVVTQGELELALIVELSGEGETWLACNHFRLSADHEQLIDMTGDAEFVRYRCPKSSKR
jgi:hypothetical protein